MGPEARSFDSNQGEKLSNPLAPGPLLALLLPLRQEPTATQGPPPPEKVRAMINAGCLLTEGATETVGTIVDGTIALKGRKLGLRVYRPAGTEGSAKVRPPVAVFFHGGGFLAGNLETHDRVCRALCRRSGAMLFAVDYRLAPEVRFPAPLEDATESARWIAREAGRFGGDARRLAVVGDSGGATLAAAVALAFRRGGPRLRLQALVNPALDPARYGAQGFEEYAYFRSLLFADDKAWRDPRIAFLRTPNLTGIAPATIIAGEEDALVTEAGEYAARLKAARVPVTFWVQPKQGHLGPLFAANASEAQEPIDRVSKALREALGSHGQP